MDPTRRVEARRTASFNDALKIRHGEAVDVE
jgi:hypothetical protein